MEKSFYTCRISIARYDYQRDPEGKYYVAIDMGYCEHLKWVWNPGKTIK